MSYDHGEGKWFEMLETGIKAPLFTLPDQNGKMHSLDEYRGKKVILYFYPKDNTPGCTSQACGYTAHLPQFEEKGAVVLGISKDSVESHKRFEEKHGLKFTLLSDENLETIKAYDVWKEKKLYGKVSMGVVRSTYVIDEVDTNDEVSFIVNGGSEVRHGIVRVQGNRNLVLMINTSNTSTLGSLTINKVVRNAQGQLVVPNDHERFDVDIISILDHFFDHRCPVKVSYMFFFIEF